jgi:hypothetical protein
MRSSHLRVRCVCCELEIHCDNFVYFCVRERGEFQLMMSGAISWWGKSRLVFMQCGMKITATEYLDTLKRYHMKELKFLFKGWGFAWQQVLSRDLTFL